MRRRLALLATLAVALVGALAVPSTAAAEEWRGLYLENGHRVCDIAFGLGNNAGGLDWWSGTAVGHSNWNLNYCRNPANGRTLQLAACDAHLLRDGSGTIAGKVSSDHWGSCFVEAWGENVFCWCNFKSEHFVMIFTNGWATFRDRCGGCLRGHYIGDGQTGIQYRIWANEAQIWLYDADANG